MRIVLLLLFILATPKAWSACTTPNGVAGSLDYFTGTNDFQYCDGTNWVSLGSAASTSALVSGWPDAIVCNVTNPNWGTIVFRHIIDDYNADNLNYYRFPSTSFYDIRFNNATKAFDSYLGLTTTDCNVSIATLISNGQAKFYGNDISTVNSDADGDTKIYTEQSADEDKIRFDTAGSERMIIDNNGYLGIGETSPGNVLHVKYPSAGISPVLTLESGGTTSGDGTGFEIKDSADEQDFLLYTDSANEYTRIQSLGAMAFHTGFTGVAGTNERVTITAAGKVGIGDITPDTALVVSGTAKAVGSAAGLQFTNRATSADGYQWWSTGGNGYLYDHVSGLNRIFVNNAGRVGIGTVSPSNQFSVIESGATQVGSQTMGIHSETISGGSAMVWVTTDDAPASNEYFFALRSEEDSTPDNEFLFRTDGTASADGTWNTGGADYAEWFEKEEDIPRAALVGLNLKTGYARKYREGDAFLGIQSTNPGFVGNNKNGAETTEEQMLKEHVLVALVGQVKLSSQNFMEHNRKVFTTDGNFIGYRLADGNIFINAVKNNERRVSSLEEEVETLKVQLKELLNQKEDAQ